MSTREPDTAPGIPPCPRSLLVGVYVLYLGLATTASVPLFAEIDWLHEGERLGTAQIVLNGGLPFRDAFLVHGSAANRSRRRRAGLAIRYMPATSRYDRAMTRTGGAAAIRQDMSKRPIYLGRGRDRAGNDFEIGQDRPYELPAPEVS